MQEPNQIQFPELDIQSKTSLKQSKAINRDLGKVEQYRQDAKRLAEAKPTAEGSTFQEAFGKQDARANFIDSFISEKAILDDTAELVESLIVESVELVKETEKNSDLAFQRIKAEVEKFGLPFTNDNQFDFFVKHSDEVKQFDEKVDSARSYETAARQLVHAIRKRCEWITNFVVKERSKMVSVAWLN